MVTHRPGFTLIELLVTICVIIVLAGLGLAGVQALRERVKRTRTESIIALVAGTLGMAGQRGGSLSPVEHPLAGSASWPAQRPAFVRAGTAGFAAGDAVAITGEALRAGDPAWIPTVARSRLLLPDDRFTGGGADGWELPLLFGRKRSQIGILGTADSRISAWRLVPQPASRSDLDGDGTTDAAALGDARSPWQAQPPVVADLGPSDDRITTTAGTIATLLGEAQADLAKLSAIVRALPADGPLICNQLAVSLGTTSIWEAGTVRHGGAWHRYRLLGTTLVDGWGREILCFQTDGGVLRLVSAGRDGVFAWHPGADGILQTSPVATVAAGDDADGALDNLDSSRE